jgi:hypothetical protein
VGKEERTSNPIKFVLEIDGASFSIEPSDVMQDGAARKLTLQFRSAHPTVAPQVTTKSKVKVQGRIPTRRRRHRERLCPQTAFGLTWLSLLKRAR